MAPTSLYSSIWALVSMVSSARRRNSTPGRAEGREGGRAGSVFRQQSSMAVPVGNPDGLEFDHGFIGQPGSYEGVTGSSEWSGHVSVAALGQHRLIIRVIRTGVSRCQFRRLVQDRIAPRRVFTRSRQSGLGAGRAHNIVIGFLCADGIGLWPVIPPRCPCGSKLLVKPVRRLNASGGPRRSGGR